MKHFAKYIGLRLIVFILLLFCLDFVFTYSYINNKTIRTKIDYIFLNQNSQFDNIFLGSSRIEYHINTHDLNRITNTKNLNLGISGQDLSETFLTLKLLRKNRITAKTYFIQVDESQLTSLRVKSFIGASYFMPYTHIDVVRDHLKKHDTDYYQDRFIPFYRYMNYGYKIGYRELILKLSGKKRSQKFYIELNDSIQDKNIEYQFNGQYNNQLLQEIQSFARKNDLNIIFFTAPYYNPKNIESYQKFAMKNNIHSYINFIKSPEKFKDLSHLNSMGAKEFTQQLINDFIIKE